MSKLTQEPSALADVAPIGLFRNDLDGRCTYVNPRWCEISGLAPERALGHGWTDAVHPDDRAAIFAAWQCAVRDNLPFLYECRFLRPNGETIWIVAEAQAERDAHGAVTGYVGTVTDISERKRAEEALRESEARYRTIVELAQEGIWQIDADSRTTFVNQKMADMLGYTVAEMQGQSMFAFMGDDGRAIAARNVERRRQGISEEHEFRFLRKDGSELWALLQTIPLFDEQGRYKGGFATITDIGERKRAEQALRESEERYRSVITAMAEGIVIQGADQSIVACNPAAERILGLSAEQMAGRTSIDPRWHAIHEDGSPFPGETHPAVVTLRTGRPQSDVIMGVQRPAGPLVWISISSQPLTRPGETKPYAVVTSFTDVTERKRIEQSLQHSYQLLEAVFNNTHVLIAYLDPQFNFIVVNAAYAGADGRSPDFFPGKNHFAVYPNAENEAIFRRVVETGEPYQVGARPFEYVRSPERGVSHWDWKLVPIKDPNGVVVGLVLTLLDVSERVKAVEVAQAGEQLLQNVLALLPVGVWVTDPAGKIVLGNAAGQAIWGGARYVEPGQYGEYKGWWPDSGKPIAPHEWALARAVEKGETSLNEVVDIECFDGTRKTILNSALPIRGPQGEIRGAIVVNEDISERRRAEQALRESEERLRKVFEASAASISITRASDGLLLDANHAFFELTGWTRAEAVGRTSGELELWADPEGRERVLGLLRENGSVRDADWRVRTRDGGIRHVLGTIEPIRIGNEDCLLIVVQDISERVHAQERLQYLAHHDALTDLPNRVLFMDRLEQALSRAPWHGRIVAVLFLDIDRFKYINDTLGHNVGDSFLKQMAARLKVCVREGDTVARLGGDEFAVLLEDVDAVADVTPLADKILGVMAAPFALDGREIFVTTSIGISLFPGDGRDGQTLLMNADAAMYRAKELGRNNHQFYSADLSARAFERLTLEASLRHALERGEFLLHYQPQIELATQRPVGLEALLRWHHPEFGLVPPAQFIPLAEETGLIVPIGEWVLRHAADTVCAWQAAGLAPVPVTVNLSGRQFADPNLAQRIARVLEEAGLAPELLELEITEGVVMQNPQAAISTLEALARMGIRIAIDDFGTGYSSLNYLKRFPLDTLKIDQSFVRDISYDPNDASIVTAIIAMAHSMQLRVIAEGVETEAQRSFLAAHGCDGVQGYLFSRPLPADEARALVAAGSPFVPDSRP